MHNKSQNHFRYEFHNIWPVLALDGKQSVPCYSNPWVSLDGYFVTTATVTSKMLHFRMGPSGKTILADPGTASWVEGTLAGDSFWAKVYYKKTFSLESPFLPTSCPRMKQDLPEEERAEM